MSYNFVQIDPFNLQLTGAACKSEGRYRVIESPCDYVFPNRFNTYKEAREFVEEQATMNPNYEYTIVYQDARYKAEVTTEVRNVSF